MKANEFIKRQGLEEARRVLHDARGCVGVKLWGRYEFSTEDLKRLVESHELVGSYGGLESSKLTVNYPNFLNDEDVKTTNHILSKAIADVESCL